MTHASKIYKNLMLVDPERHKNWFFEASPNLEFTRHFHSVPISPAEFFWVSQHYPIAFDLENEILTPIAILSARQNHNLFLDKIGNWLPNTYIPTLIRGYPFNISTDSTGKPQLQIDEGYSFINQECNGEPFFNEKAEMTSTFTNALNFFESFNQHLEFTKIFSQALLDLNILEPIPTKFKMPSGELGSINNYLVVSKPAFETLSEQQLGRLAKTGILEPIYLHLHSLGNLNPLIAKARSTKREY